MEFTAFNKIPRLNRDIVITEKIDGTNAQIRIEQGTMYPVAEEELDEPIIAKRFDGGAWQYMRAGSRSRWLTPGKGDNFAFAHWVKTNAGQLWELGEGQHFGEWWGSGIQRGYGLSKGEKRFSLFNCARWYDVHTPHGPEILAAGPAAMPAPECCRVVPVLSTGPFRISEVELCIDFLKAKGSQAAPGFMKPEGIIVWHEAARQMFKVTCEGDEKPKGAK